MHNRRNFFKTVAPTIAAPLILPSKVWSTEVSPSERIGVGLIGMGKMNAGHLSHFLGRKDSQVLAIAEVHGFRRQEAKDKVDAAYGNKDCGAYNDFNELLARKDIDVVCIATPDHWHALAGIAAVNAGKDVYGEKPLTHNITEALKLTEAVRKTNRVFQTGSQQRSDPEFRVAVELVRNGVIGEIKTVTTSFGDPTAATRYPEQPLPEGGLDWNRWCGPAPLVPYNEALCERGSSSVFPSWRKTRDFGGGMITDWGAHHIDIAQWGLNVDDSGPVEVRAPANHESAKRGAQLIYSNGVVLTHGDGFGVSFYGTEGEVHVNRGSFKLVVKGETKFHFEKKVTKKTTITREVLGAEQMFLKDAKIKVYNSTQHHTDFLDAVRKRTKPICDVAVGATTVISCHLMNMAYWYGANIKWDPAKREFISGGDNKWLTREYRSPYILS
jgi:predicted dehydrogenase